MLELRNISLIKDNKVILNDINIIFSNDKFVVITGPNGSGKSSLVKIIMGIEKPSSGKVILDGKDITNMSIDERANIGISFAFQNPVKFKGITVYDLLKLSLNKDVCKRECCDTLSEVGLCIKDYVDREVNGTLSGGELKRIEIATVMARNPKIAIFDEPEAGIDLWSFQRLTSVFNALRKQSKGITIVISHQEKILDIADEVVLLQNGIIEKIGNKEEIINSIFVDKTCCLGDNNE
ncbi:MAG: ATP-binding cassette domain-containing protein [Bacilli bacterium]|nr:ATP-binding cassette domain-containing protein [Bacilli bacterium]